MKPLIGPTGNYICPYCGKRLNVDKNMLTRDHIVPRSFWIQVKRTSSKFDKIWKDDVGLPNINDDRNIMLVCSPCNRSKDNTLAIPSWCIYSIFRYWDTEQLKSYAEYFYYWSDCFLESLEDTVVRYKNDRYISFIAYQAEKDIHKVIYFKEEYTRRCEIGDWFIGG